MNHLSEEKSPYLLQHVHNPVDWYPWGKEAFERAEREDKPIFLSIGYSTCHWCHVMAHESFEDEEVAKVLNEHYVCIKVDREERPDVDAVYMAACQATTGSGGWPLTVIMTPHQKPFFVGTYFPKNPRYGQAGLIDILQKISSLWKSNRGQLVKTGRDIASFLENAEDTVAKTPERALIKQAASLFRRQFDAKWGGFGKAPKFPTPHNLLFLMEYSVLEKDLEALKMALTTLEAMAKGGIQDHIGGGFSRYSTDEKWLVPHFEKMLYDNALLTMAYLKAYHLTKQPHYAETARNTLDYILRELTGPQGEFYCGQDADSDGVEGKYYVFTPQEIKEVLGDKDGEEFCRLYQITSEGNFEGTSIPNRIGMQDKAWDLQDSRIQKLYEYRLHRTQLHRDDKVLLSWNGWVMIAMAMAAQILGKECYLESARRGNIFIEQHMQDENCRLYHRWREGHAACQGQLDDYAVYGLALMELYRATYDPYYLKEAMFRAEQVRELFEDGEKGGYFLTAKDAESLIIRPKEIYDGAIPSGNSAAAMLFGALSSYTGNLELRDVSDRQLAFLAGSIQQYPPGYSYGLWALMGTLYPSSEFVCTSCDENIPRELTAFLQEQYIPNLSVIVKTKENQQELSRLIPFTKDFPIPQEKAKFYMCQGGKCMKPQTEPPNIK